MKKIIKTLFGTMLLSLIICAANAQADDTLKTASVEEKAEAIASRMERELTLTKKQTRQVSQLAAQRINYLNAKNGKFANSAEAVENESLKRLSEILTQEQLAKYKALKADLKDQRNVQALENRQSIPSLEDTELDF